MMRNHHLFKITFLKLTTQAYNFVRLPALLFLSEGIRYNEKKEVISMMHQITIMLVEDDRQLAVEIREFLLRWGYQAVFVSQFENIFELFLNFRPQLVLMDINLPYYDGFYWCRKIREVSEVPVIFISSRQDDKDKIIGMAQGGDDYIEKPFNLELLKAKIEAILRRCYEYKRKDRISLNPQLYYDLQQQAFFYQEKEIEMTKQEKKILSCLMNHRSQVVSREDLMIALWDTDEFICDGTLTTSISRLRNKLKNITHQDIILTKKGIGYYIP